jgi:hypothetical protein
MPPFAGDVDDAELAALLPANPKDAQALTIMPGQGQHLTGKGYLVTRINRNTL